jgi:hypothetical protein
MQVIVENALVGPWQGKRGCFLLSGIDLSRGARHRDPRTSDTFSAPTLGLQFLFAPDDAKPGYFQTKLSSAISLAHKFASELPGPETR